MADATKHGGQFDPQQHGSGGQQADPESKSQPQNGDDDDELSQFLQKEHGHSKQSADQEVKRDREGVRKKKKQHEEQHGGTSASRR